MQKKKKRSGAADPAIKAELRSYDEEEEDGAMDRNRWKKDNSSG